MSSTKPPVLRECFHCTKTFLNYRSRPGRGKYCSQRCALEGNRPYVLSGAPIGYFKANPQVPGVNSKHLGALSEIMACEWLLRQGYEVFRNISQHGLADYVAWKPGELPILIDVKSATRGKPVNRLTQAQEKGGVRLLYVDRDQRLISFNRQDFPGNRGPRTPSEALRTPSVELMPDPLPPPSPPLGAERTPL